MYVRQQHEDGKLETEVISGRMLQVQVCEASSVEGCQEDDKFKMDNVLTNDNSAAFL